MKRKPARRNEPFNVADNEQKFLEQLQTRDESAGAALEHYYAREEWEISPEGPFGYKAREALQKAIGMLK